jgi:hypothetical protein
MHLGQPGPKLVLNKENSYWEKLRSIIVQIFQADLKTIVYLVGKYRG